MTQRKNLLFLTVLLFLAMPLILTGTASAGYLPDGATQDATSGGWDLPQDMGTCVTGINANGSLVIDSSKTSRPDCIAETFPVYTTQAACGNTSNAGGAHFWATTCVDSSGHGISLNGLDRTAAMCQARGGTWTSACTSSWQYAGRDATYSNGKYVSGGFDQGFCYARVDVTAQFPTKEECVEANSIATPMLNPWSSSGVCSYSYGVGGGASASKVTAMDGTTTVASGAALPATLPPNMGQCLLAGYTWNPYAVYQGGTTAMNTSDGPATVATNVVAGNWECLRCHNSTSQYNSIAERWKESYLKQGHKNMLRKVTSGYQWGGPDANGNISLYNGWSGTGAGDGTFNWTANPPTATKPGTGGWTDPLLYIFGDWLAPAPEALDVIVNANGHALYNGSGAYTCSACHTTGFSNQTPAFCNGDLTQTSKSACDAKFPYPTPNGRSKWTEGGVCSMSSYVNSADCTLAGGIWYPTQGVENSLYPTGGAEPNATYPGLNWGTASVAFAPAWDQNSIECSRCHAVTFPELYDSTTSVYNNNSAPSYAAASGNGHDWGTAISTGAAITNMCFGCHQATAKTNNGTGLDVDLNNPATPGLNATGTGFTGHPIGEWFLNSPHERYAGKMAPNQVGKYDIGYYANNSFNPFGTFNTQFNDGSCSVSTLSVNGQAQEIRTLADCTKAAGTWSYRSDQGTCTSCHDNHNSLFVASEADKAIKKECMDCHSNDSTMNKAQAPIIDVSLINHPTSAGTPFDTTLFGNPCEVCHMPDDPGTGYAMHLMRINTSASYSTFPTASQFSSGQKLALTAPESYVDAAGNTKTYSNAIWLDLDLTCGQCHGGDSYGTCTTSSGTVDTTNNTYPLCTAAGETWTPKTKNGAPFFAKAHLAQIAPTIHGKASQSCEITGEVLQTAGGPGISGITVKLKEPGKGVIAKTTTDANGQYSFAPTPTGTYKIVAKQAGFTFPGPQPLTFSACTGTDPVTGSRTVSVPDITRTSYIIWAYSNKPNTKVVITNGAERLEKVTSASGLCSTAANPGPSCTESNPYFVKFKDINGTWTFKAKRTGFDCTGVVSPVTLPNRTIGDAVEIITCTKK
jgi:hypothetical protein